MTRDTKSAFVPIRKEYLHSLSKMITYARYQLHIPDIQLLLNDAAKVEKYYMCSRYPGYHRENCISKSINSDEVTTLRDSVIAFHDFTINYLKDKGIELDIPEMKESYER